VPIPPLVSVVIPAYDAAAFLAEAVASVLRQTWRDLEVIVVDDGSSDGTGALADELAAGDDRVRVVHQVNGGPSAARNAGIAVAQGEYLCFLDADDAFLPDKIERQLTFLLHHPECDLVYSDHYLGDDHLKPTFLNCRRPPPIPMQELLVYRNWFAVWSPLIRARLVAKVGKFDEGLRGSEDWDYWLRASKCGVFSYLPGAVGVYRTHPRQAHKDSRWMRGCMEAAIRKHFRRGSREWRAVRAAAAWCEAKQHWARRSYGRMIAQMVRCAWLARSHRTLKTVVELMDR
jgi:glycosyltransferase involved in cell wall biosynthesis